MTNEPSRLDRIEQIVAENAIAIAQQRATSDQWFDQMQQAQDRTQQQIDSNARAIEANSAAIASTARAVEIGRQETNEVREDLRNATQMILDLGTSFDAQFERIERQFEQDRAERLALSADVRSLVAALRERFRGNGQS